MRIFAIAFVVGLAACSTTSGRNFNVESAGQIHPGLTTKNQVVDYLGQPYTQEASNGAETWAYTYALLDPKVGAQAFVPFVGGLLPGAFGADTKSRSVRITFDKSVVATCQMSASSGQSSSGGGLAGMMSMMTPTQNTETSDCFRP